MLRSARLIAAAAVLVGLAGCGAPAEPDFKLVVIGIDGMDYGITRGLMDQGRMPNFSRLAEQGIFSPLETAIPPQSPVAWSNVTTGMDSGGHGIFDFVHRDEATYIPEESMISVPEAGLTINIGQYQFPLSGGSPELTRQGRSYWEVLENHGIESSIFRMPVNFPPIAEATRELSGMGTKDLRGTSGTFGFYTSRRFAFRGADIDNGEAFEVEVVDGIVEADIVGPDNPFLQVGEDGLGIPTLAPFTVYVDAVDDVVKLVVDSEERVLHEGDWSDWIPVSFDLIPTQAIGGMVRFYLKSVRPDFELYVSPVDFDPIAPALPISHPASFAADLADATGRFYTEEMPEDADALLADVLDYDEYLAQAKLAGDEYIEQFYYALENFNNGHLFYYFGNLDQVSHAMWHTRDPEHPRYNAERDAPYADVIDDLYVQFDDLIGYALDNMGDDTQLIVLSDHGFGSWRREFDLNAWLAENGYLTPVTEDPNGDLIAFTNVDWSQPQAYNAGLNSLYINLQGREEQGIVAPEDRAALVDRIAEDLLATIDPQTGQPAITKVYKTAEIFSDGDGEALANGPDIIVGYAEGYRTSGDSAIGVVGTEVLRDNTEDWPGDHEWDHEAVPGVLFSSRPLQREVVRLQDVAAAILAAYGIDEPVQPAD